MPEDKKYPRKVKFLESEYATYRKGVLDYFCESILKEPCILYDPMAGTAPLLPIMETNGYSSFFNDLVPIHYFVNRAKSYITYKTFQKNGIDWYIKELLKLLAPLKGKSLYLDSEWISDKVLSSLVKAWEKSNNYEKYQDYLLKAIILLSIRSLSSCTPSKNPTWFKPGGVSQDQDIAAIIKTCANKFNEYYQTFYVGKENMRWNRATITMLPAISNDLVQKADLIITSPPYANRLDLMRQYGPESYFLSKVGYEISTKDILGTTVVSDYDSFSSDYEFLISNSEHAKQLFSRIKKNNEHGADYYLKYYCRFFSGLSSIMIKAFTNLSENGKAYVVTQDNMHRGFCIEMDTVLRQVLKNKGWSSKLIKKWERHHMGLQNVSRKHAFVKPKHFEKVIEFWK